MSFIVALGYSAGKAGGDLQHARRSFTSSRRNLWAVAS